MKKYLQRISLLLVGGFVASLMSFSPENTSAFNTRVYSKEAACKLTDGFHSKSLEVNYPGFLPETNEFYKKGGKIVFVEYLNEYKGVLIYRGKTYRMRGPYDNEDKNNSLVPMQIDDPSTFKSIDGSQYKESKKLCNLGEDFSGNLYAMDSISCYGTYSGNSFLPIEKIGKRVK